MRVARVRPELVVGHRCPPPVVGRGDTLPSPPFLRCKGTTPHRSTTMVTVGAHRLRGLRYRAVVAREEADISPPTGGRSTTLTRADIVEAARVVVAAEGVDGLTMRRLAEELGV